MKTFTFYNDPGHGWLKVTQQDLSALGLSEQSFSIYSYVTGDNLYLEEDCDAPKFLNAYKAKHGAMPTIKESHTNSSSRIRRYPRIQKDDCFCASCDKLREKGLI